MTLEKQQKESEIEGSVDEEETLSEEDAIIDQYIDEISAENFQSFRENALQLMKQEDYQNACLIWRAMIIKGESLFGSPESSSLAESYMSLGECLFQKTLESGDLIGADEQRQENLELINQFIDDEGQFDNEGFQQKIQENIMQIASEQVIAKNHQQAPIGQTRAEEDAEQIRLDQQPPENDQQEVVNDIDIAIENLETAISIYKKIKVSQIQQEQIEDASSHISQCHILISDCLNYMENFPDSLIELDKAMEEILLNPANKIQRRLAEIYFLKGNTYMQRIQEDKAFIKDALIQYCLAEAILQEKLQNLTENQNQEKREIEDCLEVFRQKIDDIQEEIKELENVDISQIKDMI